MNGQRYRPTRRTVLALAGATAAGLAHAPGAAARPRGPEGRRGRRLRVYLGAYTGGDAAHGIGVASADPDTGALRLESVVPAEDPSFLALSATRRVLYAVNEVEEGGVSAYALAPDGAVRRFLGRSPSGGAHPCHLALHPGGRHLFTADYTSGTVGVVALRPDGAPGEVVQVVRYTGSGPDPERQDGPHAHMVLPDPAGRRLLAVDLGTDTVHVHRFDARRGLLTDGAEARMAPGSGPRHLAFHPSGRTVYVLGELDSTLTSCAYDAARGTLTPVATVPILPKDADPIPSTAAEVLVSADGRFVYASNRGHDTVTVLAVDASDTTRLRPVSHHPSGGSSPRHLAFDPAQRLLYTANQHSGTVAVLRRDPVSGALSPAGEPLAFPRAVCVLPAGRGR
ncbi:lactonase family protein [Streptomyces sp. DH37]|uniref:lactonase family protein n=1 Tax=Streptomyces sp. DH37 TaxID=3040122 RepID=UPI0024410113|nr:lactonase family protein [Streptomyces sp. DH37]MDG9703901.1 lactonase family protein [Streptomyces sp. DH37]